MAGKEENRIFVGGLSWDVTERQLEHAFSPFGKILESQIMLERDTGRPRGFGFITFADRRSMDEAIREMHGRELGERTISVNKAQPKMGEDLDHGYRGGYSSSGRGRYAGGDRPVAQDECYKCGRFGHWARDCPSAGGGRVGSGGMFSSRSRYGGADDRGDRFRDRDRYIDDRYDGGRYGDRDRFDSRDDRYGSRDRYISDSTSVNNAGIHLLEIDLVIVMLVLIVFLKMVLAKREGIEMLLQEVMIGMEQEGQRETTEEATGTGLALMIVRAWEVARLHLTAINNCYAGSTFRLKQYA
ncbi:glycine-rich RNA-binding protein RZ1C isoform X1 [Gossypium hirsutum]|uniref:Glycine-rich RNA-binding protein RZ1C isoform X1 n=1 Tax=Gossypium hirsutum TaxID=3635 RepID=A0ABM2YU19_GOSHI|nr:glycine-rich RNA-binding protein RZ1C isoform X1 [Gossypium hirsutum]